MNCVEAIFLPLNPSSLNDTAPPKGYKDLWVPIFQVSDPDSPYNGMMAFKPTNLTYGWVPACDLKVTSPSNLDEYIKCIHTTYESKLVKFLKRNGF